MINTLEIGDLVSNGTWKGVVIYSSPVINESNVLFTVWWCHKSLWDYQRNLGDIFRIEKPSQKLIEFGRGKLFYLLQEDLQHREEDRIFTKLDYLTAMNVLNKYEKEIVC